jgi:hypothetical protein
MSLPIRKFVSYAEEVLIEGGKAAPVPLSLYAVAAIITNPWANRGFVEDLRPEIREWAPVLGRELTQRIVALAGGGDRIEGYGKASVVGTNGEIEHASAMIHTLRFGNNFRKAVGAKSYLSFTNVRGAPGSPIFIPLMHKGDEGMRSHYLTIPFTVSDAPAPDEIVVALGASVGGRPHHRIGDRYQDLAELGDLNA